MSGTSCDGIDACAVEIVRRNDTTSVSLRASATFEYTDEERSSLLELTSPKTGTVDRICEMNFVLGELLAQAAGQVAEKARCALSEIDVIGSHGHTVYHQPPSGGRRGATLQIGEPCVIAERTGVTVVADFRTRDVAAGGHGAPLVPYVDFLLLRDETENRVVLNIGGIANVTILPAGCSIDEVIAFDTGPGNVLIDALAIEHTNGELRCDRDGALARAGRVDEAALEQLLGHPYFAAAVPKSTGRELFNLSAMREEYPALAALSAIDQAATLTALTARSIAFSVQGAVMPWDRVARVIASGGGVENPVLMETLGEAVAPARLCTSDAYGLPPDMKEAIAFAVLADEALRGRPSNVIGATGARRRVVLGKICPQ